MHPNLSGLLIGCLLELQSLVSSSWPNEDGKMCVYECICSVDMPNLRCRVTSAVTP